MTLCGAIVGGAGIGLARDALGSYSPVGGALSLTLLSTALLYMIGALLAMDLRKDPAGAEVCRPASVWTDGGRADDAWLSRDAAGASVSAEAKRRMELF